MACNEIWLSVLTRHLLEHQTLRSKAITPLKGLRLDNKSEWEHVTTKQFVEVDITKLTLNTAKHETRTQSHKWCTIIVPSTLEAPSRCGNINSILIKIKFTLDYSRPRCMAWMWCQIVVWNDIFSWGRLNGKNTRGSRDRFDSSVGDSRLGTCNIWWLTCHKY